MGYPPVDTPTTNVDNPFDRILRDVFDNDMDAMKEAINEWLASKGQ